uniref:Uncharacterized protein n=3 Tax=Aegilops tauschii subsp. strangulata TaxID=200361 RepID=A0A453LDM7_AEGTS
MGILKLCQEKEKEKMKQIQQYLICPQNLTILWGKTSLWRKKIYKKRKVMVLKIFGMSTQWHLKDLSSTHLKRQPMRKR